MAATPAARRTVRCCTLALLFTFPNLRSEPMRRKDSPQKLTRPGRLAARQRSFRSAQRYITTAFAAQ
jgi:hypothetical protein